MNITPSFLICINTYRKRLLFIRTESANTVRYFYYPLCIHGTVFLKAGAKAAGSLKHCPTSPQLCSIKYSMCYLYFPAFVRIIMMNDGLVSHHRISGEQQWGCTVYFSSVLPVQGTPPSALRKID